MKQSSNFFLPGIQPPQVHLRHHRRPRLTLSGRPSPNAQCFSYCESESAEHYLCICLMVTLVTVTMLSAVARMTMWCGLLDGRASRRVPLLHFELDVTENTSDLVVQRLRDLIMLTKISTLLILMLLPMTLARMNMTWPDDIWLQCLPPSRASNNLPRWGLCRTCPPPPDMHQQDAIIPLSLVCF